MARPAKYPLALYRGDSYKWQFVFWLDDAKTQPIDLTGVVAAAQINDVFGGPNAIDMDCVITLPNIVDVSLIADKWTGISLKGGNWDLQMTYPSAEVITFVAGAVTVAQDVTP